MVNSLKKDAWNFASGQAEILLSKLKTLPSLEQFGVVFSGTGTRADQVYFMQRYEDKFFSRSLGQWVEIEPELMKPALTGRDIDSYSFEPDNYLLFPYQLLPEQTTLIPAQDLASRFPKAWAYLSHPTNRHQLESRDKGSFQGRIDWYKYSYPRNMNILNLPKIVLPDVAGQPEFTFDDEGRYIIDTAYAIRLLPNFFLNPLFIITLLNSSLMLFFIRETGTDLRGGYFRMKTAYLNPFPIPTITFTTPTAERERLTQQIIARYDSGDNAGVVTAAQAAITAEQTDVVHDLLAHLAQRMIDLNKAKQAEIRRFLGWLEGVLRIHVAGTGRIVAGARQGVARTRCIASLRRKSIATHHG